MLDSSAAVATVFVDADNTLWDTDGVYAAAQLRLLALIENVLTVQSNASDRLRYIRSFDQYIAEHHHAGLRYPPKLLAQAVALGLRGESIAAASRRVLRESNRSLALGDSAANVAVSEFQAALQALPQVRPGVEKGLRRLKALSCVIIVLTEGSRARIASTAKALDLESNFDRIIEAPKQTLLYHRVARLSRAPGPMFMVGDQLQRDIAPAKAAGLETIYFPGNFSPKWEPEAETIGPDHRITHFEQAADIVETRVMS